MPECHKCRFNGLGSDRCLKCSGPSEQSNHHGHSTIPLDALPEAVLATLCAPDPEPEDNHRLADFMQAWLRMPANTREIVAMLLTDGSLSWAAIAKHLRISRQAVHKALKKAARTHPEFAPLIRLRTSKSKRKGIEHG